MTYQSTKRYGHELGLSACFRQYLAGSHCNLLHGYALSFKFVFEADTLDDRNWVQDFGSLKKLKQDLIDLFDHKLLVAEDDPQKDIICSLAGLQIADVVELPAVGCEAFAQIAYSMASEYVRKGVRVVSCECAEHGANSAIYIGEK